MTQLTLTVRPQMNQTNPLEDYTGLRLIGFHRRYGEAHEFKTPEEVVRYASEGGKHLVKVYMRDHGAQMYATGDENPFGDPWDSGFYGFLVFEKAYYAEQHGWKRLSTERKLILDDEAADIIQDYTIYSNGWAWEYLIRDEDDEIVDSGEGFHGEEEALAAGEAALAELNLEILEERSGQ